MSDKMEDSKTLSEMVGGETKHLPVDEHFTLYRDEDGDYVVKAHREHLGQHLVAHGATPDEAVQAMCEFINMGESIKRKVTPQSVGELEGTGDGDVDWVSDEELDVELRANGIDPYALTFKMAEKLAARAYWYLVKGTVIPARMLDAMRAFGLPSPNPERVDSMPPQSAGYGSMTQKKGSRNYTGL